MCILCCIVEGVHGEGLLIEEMLHNPVYSPNMHNLFPFKINKVVFYFMSISTVLCYSFFRTVLFLTLLS